MENFDGGNFDVFDAFQPDRQNLTHQIFKAVYSIWLKAVTIIKIFSVKYLKSQYPSKFSLPLYGIRIVNLWNTDHLYVKI